MNLIYLASIFILSFGISLSSDTINPEESKAKLVFYIKSPSDMIENNNDSQMCYDLNVFDYISGDKVGKATQCYNIDVDSGLIFVHQEIDLISGKLENDFVVKMESIDSEFTSFTHKVSSTGNVSSKVSGTGIFSTQIKTIDYLGMISLPNEKQSISNVNALISIYVE